MYQTQLPFEVEDRIRRDEPIDIIDVREDHEWACGHIPQARHIPLGELPERLAELDKSKETIIVCRSGSRSAAACEYLAEAGYKVTNMLGGMLQWTGDVAYGSDDGTNKTNGG